MAVSNSTDRFNGVLASKAIKVPVKRATNVNQVLSGDPGPIDGWTWSDGDRILLYGQTNPIENGIWEVNLSSSWSRAPDFDGTRDATESTLITAGRSGSDNPIMYILTTDTDPIRIGTDALAFQIYFDPDNPAAAGLQAVTDVGNTTTNDIIINPATPYTPAFIISNAGRIELGNTTADGTVEIGSVSPTGMQISATGIVDLFQFTGLDEFRILGDGAPDGAVLVMGERNSGTNPLPGPIASFATIWVRDDTPNVLVFTDDAGTDWVLNVVDTLQSVTDNGNTTTNDIDLTGSNLILDDAGEVQFGTVAGGEINIRYNAVDNSLEVYDASATNTTMRVGPGINNLIINPDQNANAVVTIGESSTLRGDAQQAIFNMYGEDTGVIALAQVQNTGALWWFNAPTLPIEFKGTDFVMDTVNARIRGVNTGFTEEKRLVFEDDTGAVHAHVGPQSNGDFEIRNFSQDDSVRIQSTLAGGSAHTFLEHNQNSSTFLNANAGRDVELRIGNLTFVRCDNLGETSFFYAGSSEVMRARAQNNGGLAVAQTVTGVSNDLKRALTVYDLGQTAEYWDYDYTNQVMSDPTQQRFKLNNADQTLVTAIAVDDGGLTLRDPAGLLSAIQAGTQIRIAETKDLAVWAVYEATGPAVDNTGWWEIPVAYVANGNAFSTTVREPMMFTFSNLTSDPSPAGGFSPHTSTWNYDTGTTIVDPGNGNFRFDSLTIGSIQRMSIDDLDADGTDRQDLLRRLTQGSLMTFVDPEDDSTWQTFAVISVTEQTGYFEVACVNKDGSGTFWAATTPVQITLSPEPAVETPTTAFSLYYGEVTTGGSPLPGLRENANVRIRPESAGASIIEQWDGATQVCEYVANGTILKIETQSLAGTGRIQLETDLFEVYDKDGTLPVFQANGIANYVQIGANNMASTAGPPLYQMERASAGADAAKRGQWWVRNDTPNVPMFTDDAGNDWQLNDVGAQSTTITAGWTTGSGGSFTVAANAPLFLAEQATNDSPAAGQGQLWVRNDTPNTIIFTDDAGTDHDLLAASIGGSIADNQIAVGAATADEIEGSANLTWDGTVLDVAGNLEIEGTAPYIEVRETDAALDEKVYRWRQSAGDLFLSGYDDSDVLDFNVFQIFRNAGVVTEIDIQATTVDIVGDLECSQVVYIVERAAASTDLAGQGQLWVRNDAPNTLMFTDDTGQDFPVAGQFHEVTKYKTASQSISNSTTFTNDTHLSGWNLEADTSYRIDMFFSYDGDPNPDFKWRFNFSQTTQEGYWKQHAGQDFSATPSSELVRAIETSISISSSGVGQMGVHVIAHFTTNATTGGTLDFQWAQNVSDATAVVMHRGCWMTLTRLGP